MDFTTIATMVSTALQPLADLIDDVQTSDEERLQLRNEFERIKSELIARWIGFAVRWMELDAQNKSWLTRNWRAMAMCVILFMLVNNYILCSYFEFAKKLEMPPLLITILASAFGVAAYGENQYKKRKLKKLKKAIEKGIM